jgi:hypothetical protein
MKNGAKHIQAGILLVTVLRLAGTTVATPITFNEFPVGTLISNQYADDGVLFLPGTVMSRLPQITADNPAWWIGGGQRGLWYRAEDGRLIPNPPNVADRVWVREPRPWAVLVGAFGTSSTGIRPVRLITGRGLGACAPVSWVEAAGLDKGLNRDAVAADRVLGVALVILP